MFWKLKSTFSRSKGHAYIQVRIFRTFRHNHSVASSKNSWSNLKWDHSIFKGICGWCFISGRTGNGQSRFTITSWGHEDENEEEYVLLTLRSQDLDWSLSSEKSLYVSTTSIHIWGAKVRVASWGRRETTYHIGDWKLKIVQRPKNKTKKKSWNQKMN